MEIKEKIKHTCFHIKINKIICDICKKEFKGDKSKWIPLEQGSIYSNYNTEETSVSFKYGNEYPEGGSGYIIKYNICPYCFMNKLVPWLESQGAAIVEEEYDY